MSAPIIKIKRGSTAPSVTLSAGEFAIDQVEKNLYLGVEVGGVVSNEIVGGSGTFATKTYVDNAVSSGISGLSDMAFQSSGNVTITGGSISVGAITATSGAFVTLTASTAPTGSNDVVRKTDLDSAISALGSVFHFVGDTSLATTPFDLGTLPDLTTGAYYRVDVAGTYTDTGFSAAAKIGDSFVKTTTTWLKLDNVDAAITGTTNEIVVSGDEDAGYVVGIASAFSSRVTDLETKTQNIDIAATTANITKFNGVINAGDPTSVGVEINEFGSLVAVMSGGDRYFDVSYFGCITLGAQFNPTNTVNIRNGLIGIDHPTNGTPSIENFIIDGGVY